MQTANTQTHAALPTPHPIQPHEKIKFRTHLMAQGKTIAEWCTERNLSPISTYRTLSGLEKGRNGKAFESLTAIRGYLQIIETGER